MTRSNYAIIVAGGKGERMNAAVPKQFLEIKSKPVLMHTLELFHRYDAQIQLIVVLPESQFAYWDELCQKHRFSVPHQVVAGGETRFGSVKRGLALVGNDGLVAVHDGVRPLVSLETIDRCVAKASVAGAVIPVVELVDSIRQLNDTGSAHADRTQFRLVQTPQVFTAEILQKAYSQEFSPFFTDDASVVEAIGHPVEMVDGNRENIKITTEFDLKVAEALLA